MDHNPVNEQELSSPCKYINNKEYMKLGEEWHIYIASKISPTNCLLIRVCKEHSTGKKKGGSDSSHLNGVTAVNSSSNGTG